MQLSPPRDKALIRIPNPTDDPLDQTVLPTTSEFRPHSHLDPREWRTYSPNPVGSGSKVDLPDGLYLFMVFLQLGAAARGYLDRKLLQTDKVKTLIQTIQVESNCWPLFLMQVAGLYVSHGVCVSGRVIGRNRPSLS